jgi:hypothetical protein
MSVRKVGIVSKLLKEMSFLVMTCLLWAFNLTYAINNITNDLRPLSKKWIEIEILLHVKEEWDQSLLGARDCRRKTRQKNELAKE